MKYHTSAERFTFGFSVFGDCTKPPRLVDHRRAFASHCARGSRSESVGEAHLSAFQFKREFPIYLERHRSTRGFDGPCWAERVWFDIDREGDLAAAHADARRLAVAIVAMFDVDETDVAVFFSGSEGFHVGVLTSLWEPESSCDFHRITRRFCETIAERAGVAIDGGVYGKVRCFRAPNSVHPKTGLYKRFLWLDELYTLKTDAVVKLAERPSEHYVGGYPTGTREEAAALWAECAEQVRREAEAHAARRANRNGEAKLNRGTLEFIRDGAGVGDRHRRLYSASANLAEFGAPLPLCRALLEESALDSGLPPKDVKHGVRCGWVSVNPDAFPKAVPSE